MDSAGLRAAILLHLRPDDSLADSAGTSDQGHLAMFFLALAKNHCSGLEPLAFRAVIPMRAPGDGHKKYSQILVLFFKNDVSGTISDLLNVGDGVDVEAFLGVKTPTWVCWRHPGRGLEEYDGKYDVVEKEDGCGKGRRGREIFGTERI